MKSLEKISEGAFIILLGTFLSKILGYVYRFIVARSGSEVYGLLSTGLAAFGKHNETCINKMNSFLKDLWNKKNSIPELKNLKGKHWCNSLYLSTTPEGIEITKTFREKYFSEFSKEDIGFAIQYITEEKVIELIKKEVKDTLNMLKLYKQNYCVVVEASPSIMGMLKKVQSYITWGDVDEETLALLKEKRQEKEKTFYRLHPPIKGFERKGIKIPFRQGGALGNRREKINDLIKKMI